MNDIKVLNASIEEIESNLTMEGLSEIEIEKVTDIMKRFIKSYVEKEESISDETWLYEELKAELPVKAEKLFMMSHDIIESVHEFDTNVDEINEACDNGTGKEVWFVNKVSDASVGISVIEFGNYLNGIDNSITNANAQMMRTVTTNAGQISQCMNLDGFIAEQYVVNTFNMQSQIEGSNYVAEVLVPEPGQTYGLNSFDSVIKDTITGKIVHQYQFKFGKDAKATIDLLRDGNYNNQRFVVPSDQVEEVRKAFPGKSVESYMGGTDKVSVKSGSLTKEDAKNLQLETQEKGVLPSNDWNTYNTKELALNISKNAGMVGLQSALIFTGFDLVAKTVKGEHINESETIELALRTGVDSGIKAAMAGAIKVGSEKGIITIIPKGTPVGIITNIACMGIENAKTLAKVASGELTTSQALDQMGRTSTAMVYGLGWGATGVVMGAAAFAWIPIVGAVVGGIAGGMVGYMAGSQFGNAIYSGLKEVGSAVRSAAKSVWSGVKSVRRKISSGISGMKRKLFG